MKHVRPNVSQFAAQWTQAQPITEPEKPKLKPRPRRRNRIPILETPDLPHEEREADENVSVEAVNDGKRAAENVACFVNDAGYRRNVRAYRKEIREIRPDNGRVKPPGQTAAAFDGFPPSSGWKMPAEKAATENRQTLHTCGRMQQASNPLSKAHQKQHMKQAFLARAREQKVADAAVENIPEVLRRFLPKLGERQVHLFPVALVCSLLLFMTGGLSSFMPLGEAISHAFIIGTYPAEEADVLAAERAYCEMEKESDIPVYREGTVYREPEIGVNPDFNPFRTDTVKEKVHKMPAGGGVSPRTAPLDGWQNLYEIDSRAGDAGLADRFDEMDSALQAFLEGEPEPVQQSLELGGTAGFCGQLKLSDRLYATTLGDALAVVDVGRARERVLFERYLRLLGNNATVSQQLLFPERIELSPADGRLMAEIREELSSLGFEFSANGPAGVTAENGPADNKGAGEGVTYEITGIPPELPAGMVQDVLHEALARVRELGGVPESEKVRDLAAILARRGASGVRAQDGGAQRQLPILVAAQGGGRHQHRRPDRQSRRRGG